MKDYFFSYFFTYKILLYLRFCFIIDFCIVPFRRNSNSKLKWKISFSLKSCSIFWIFQIFRFFRNVVIFQFFPIFDCSFFWIFRFIRMFRVFRIFFLRFLHFFNFSNFRIFENYTKCRIWILIFYTNFCRIKCDLSGSTVWPQASG